MAYSTERITKVEAYITTAYDSDDGALDAVLSACMVDGILTVACDEWKEGTICGKIEINWPPSAITSLKIRFYVQDMRTAGDVAILPYVSASSVSITNKIVVTYDTEPVWEEHICTPEFIAELGDVGGKCYVRWTANDGIAKDKIAEIEADITIATASIDKHIYDDNGDPISGVTVKAFPYSSILVLGSFFDSDVSDALGAYHLDLYAGDWILLFFKEGATHPDDLMDISQRITVTI